MKNRKGFTLVELLAVIVILGIITGISIPLIRNIQDNNKMRKFTTYQDSLKVSAKLYVDSYAEDLFGNEKSGCAVINYSQMEDKSLLKDISVDQESCKSDFTCVRVVKLDDKYTYYPMIGCGSMGADGKASSVTVKLPTSSSCNIGACGVDTRTIVSFAADPENSTAISFQRKNMVVKLGSYTGFHEDYDIEYGFANKVGAPAGTFTAPNVSGGWKRLEINYLGGNEQKKKIENGQMITLSSKQVTTTEGLTGDYYLVLKVNKLMNITGRTWNTDPERGPYVYLGPYRVDNTKPVFANTSTVESSVSGYNHVAPKLKISVTDNYSSASDLRMCTSYDSDSCSKKVSDIKDKTNGWVTYSANKTLSKIQNNQDGSTHTVYVTVADAAGNYETKSYSYTITQEFTITYNGNGSTGGSTASTTCLSGVSCTLRANGFSKTGYNYTGWYNAASGGTKYGTTTTITSDVTIYAQWVDDINPTCSTAKTNIGSTSGVTVTITCSDSGSGCAASNTLKYTGVKASKTYTVKDNAGNSGTCDVSVNSYTCNSRPCGPDCGKTCGGGCSRRFRTTDCNTACMGSSGGDWDLCCTETITCIEWAPTYPCPCDTCYDTCYS